MRDQTSFEGHHGLRLRLADHFLNAVGLGGRERCVWTLDQGRQPVGQPGLTTLIDLGAKGVETGRLSRLYS